MIGMFCIEAAESTNFLHSIPAVRNAFLKLRPIGNETVGRSPAVRRKFSVSHRLYLSSQAQIGIENVRDNGAEFGQQERAIADEQRCTLELALNSRPDIASCGQENARFRSVLH